MKRIVYLIVSVFCFISCEQEVGELTAYESPRLVVNALLSASDETQSIRIRQTGRMHAEMVDGADVTLSLNGSPFYHHVTSCEDSLLVPTHGFKVGDEVSIHVSREDMYAVASAEVLPPVIITGIDTLTVLAQRYSSSSGMEPHRRLLVHLRLPDEMDSSDTHFFRAEVVRRVIEPASYSLVGDRVEEVSYKENTYFNTFSYASDPALCESEGLDQDKMPVSFDWLEGLKNIYHLFRSTYFKDREYTLHLDFPTPHFLSQYGWAQQVMIRIFSISRTEYNYLMALSAYKTLDSGTIYDTEPGITTNVKGGAGIFCIETMAVDSVYDDHHLIQAGDYYQDF